MKERFLNVLFSYGVQDLFNSDFLAQEQFDKISNKEEMISFIQSFAATNMYAFTTRQILLGDFISDCIKSIEECPDV